MKNDLKTYIFQTGHAKGLAQAEIEAIHGKVIKDEVADGFLIEAQVENPIMHLNRMGSIVRITEVLTSGPASIPLNFEEWVTKALKQSFHSYEGKKRFGISMHPKNEKVLKKILIISKKNLTKMLGNLRFVNKNFQNLSSVQAWHEKLLNPGAVELHLFQSESKWYLSKTLAIQDFEWYSHRDYDRPAKSIKTGLFPPKLAQILINLSEAPLTHSIYDPFCGSGTLLQEAWLMGYKAVGSDLSPERVNDCKTNLEWLQKAAEHREKSLPAEPPIVFLKDATKLTKEDLPKGPFTIVTETSLGPLLTKALPETELKSLQKKLESLYESFLKNLKTTLSFPITMVFTAPYHHKNNERYFLPHLPEILTRYSQIIPLSDQPRPSLFYERKGQWVSREIWKILIKP